MTTFHYRCTTCARTYVRDGVRYLCSVCGATYRPGIPLTGVLEAVFDPDEVRRGIGGKNGWDALLPVERRYFPDIAVGNTPFLRASRLGAEAGVSDLWIKNDALNPSGSLKDRASFFVVAEAIRLGEERIVTASTGNAASALAAVAAAAGKKAVIFLPASAPRGKLAQILLYGATAIPVRGSYDDAFRLSLEYTARAGGLNRNTAYHPLTIEGKKTAGLEIFAQNGDSVPDVLVVPVGDGVILAGVHKAFADLKAAGVTETVPRLLCVQSCRSDAIHRYFTTGSYSDANAPDTCADSIAVRTPSNAHLAVRALRESNGSSVTVTDAEILAAQALLARTTGIFAEPAAAAPLAGLHHAVRTGWIRPGERVVLLVTGNGLKDIDTAMRSVPVPEPIEPTIGEALRRMEQSAP